MQPDGFNGQIRLSLLAFFLMVTFWAEREQGKRAERQKAKRKEIWKGSNVVCFMVI
jgi:preprotein translocase subunit YajC